MAGGRRSLMCTCSTQTCGRPWFHFSATFATFRMGDQRSISAFTNRPNCAGVRSLLGGKRADRRRTGASGLNSFRRFPNRPKQFNLSAQEQELSSTSPEKTAVSLRRSSRIAALRKSMYGVPTSSSPLPMAAARRDHATIGQVEATGVDLAGAVNGSRNLSLDDGVSVQTS
jgi:hypothetical protein